MSIAQNFKPVERKLSGSVEVQEGSRYAGLTSGDKMVVNIAVDNLIKSRGIRAGENYDDVVQGLRNLFSQEDQLKQHKSKSQTGYQVYNPGYAGGQRGR